MNSAIAKCLDAILLLLTNLRLRLEDIPQFENVTLNLLDIDRVGHGATVPISSTYVDVLLEQVGASELLCQRQS
jgi:hypothetical protein